MTCHASPIVPIAASLQDQGQSRRLGKCAVTPALFAPAYLAGCAGAGGYRRRDMHGLSYLLRDGHLVIGPAHGHSARYGGGVCLQDDSARAHAESAECQPSPAIGPSPRSSRAHATIYRKVDCGLFHPWQRGLCALLLMHLHDRVCIMDQQAADD